MRALLSPALVELVTPVVLGLRPSLHAAARKVGTLPVPLHDKVSHTEPGVLWTLVQRRTP